MLAYFGIFLAIFPHFAIDFYPKKWHTILIG